MAPINYILTHQKKPKTKRVARALEKKEPKIIENPKSAVFLKGKHTSDVINKVLTDLYLLKKPFAVKFSKKNDILPFDNVASLEFFANKNDTSLFAFGSHNKKRPNNLVMGRMFDSKLLDMVEFHVENYKPLDVSTKEMNAVGSKPMFIFQGEEFVQVETFAKIKNLFLDFFRGQEARVINLAGLDHVIVVSALNEKLLFRHYHVAFKKSGSKTPRIELTLMGPSMDLSVRRTRFASEAAWKQAIFKPRDYFKTSDPDKKNITHNALGDKMGRIHMEHQDLNKMALKKMKGLRKTKEEKAAAKEKKRKMETGFTDSLTEFDSGVKTKKSRK